MLLCVLLWFFIKTKVSKSSFFRFLIIMEEINPNKYFFLDMKKNVYNNV